MPQITAWGLGPDMMWFGRGWQDAALGPGLRRMPLFQLRRVNEVTTRTQCSCLTKPAFEPQTNTSKRSGPLSGTWLITFYLLHPPSLLCLSLTLYVSLSPSLSPPLYLSCLPLFLCCFFFFLSYSLPLFFFPTTYTTSVPAPFIRHT